MEELQTIFTTHSLYVPLGIIGIWRWGVWIFKEAVGLFYKAPTEEYQATMSIVTPVYNEDPDIFRAALSSWKANNPEEIIAVIDYSDDTCIEIFKEFAQTTPNCKLIITHKPGKRPALADGMAVATQEIVALIDSDTIWEKDVRRYGLAPFADPAVGGVATRQNIIEPNTFAQKAFDIQLNLRYADEMTYLDAIGDVLICLSGRTAFYRRSVVAPMLNELVHETFMGEPVISGDDKRLTYLVQAAGWKTVYQKHAQVYTPAEESIKTYMKQRLRWTRNSLRADLKAMYDGWVWKHPGLAFFQIDKVLQSGTTLLSPIYLIVSIAKGYWTAAAIIVVWWLVSRGIKLIPHFKRRPQDVVILPAFILFTFASAIMRIYALFTLNTQGWITRWDASRLNQLRFLQKAPAYLATTIIVFGLLFGVASQKETVAAVLPEIFSDRFIELQNHSTVEIPSTYGSNHENDYFKKHTVVQGDTVDSLAQTYGTSAEIIIEANNPFIINPKLLTPGQVLTMPDELPFTVPQPYRTDLESRQELDVEFNTEEDAIYFTGRGNVLTFNDLYQLSQEFGGIQQNSEKEFIMIENIHIGPGVTLHITAEDVTWLKLLSQEEKFVWLRTYNGAIIIDGVDITSWNTQTLDMDMNTEDGRAFVVAKYSGRLDISNSEVAYLGFKPEPGVVYPPKQDASPYGVSWKIPEESYGQYLMTGDVINSSFHHNYFGAYSYGATGMNWKGNEFYENLRYGLDPHDDSNYMIIEDNRFYNNGTHGLILSKRCVYNTIRNNYSYQNKINGIMLHADSNHNTVTNNLVRENSEGIVIWDSHNNDIQDNYVMGNGIGIRLNEKSSQNVIETNISTSNIKHGVYLYANAEFNYVFNNTVTDNTRGIYIKNANDNSAYNNTITHNEYGIYLHSEASSNIFSNNTVARNTTFSIYSQPNMADSGQSLRNYSYQNIIEEINLES